MKPFFIAILLLISTSVWAQLPGTRVKKRVSIGSNLTIGEGDTLLLGIGTMADKNFAYATFGGFFLGGQPLERAAANGRFVVDQVRSFSNTRFGNKTYAVITYGSGKVLVDLPIALETGEVKQIINR